MPTAGKPAGSTLLMSEPDKQMFAQATQTAGLLCPAVCKPSQSSIQLERELGNLDTVFTIPGSGDVNGRRDAVPAPVIWDYADVPGIRTRSHVNRAIPIALIALPRGASAKVGPL